MSRTFNNTMPFVFLNKYPFTLFKKDGHFIVSLELPITRAEWFYSTIFVVPMPVELFDIDIAIKLSNDVMFAILIDAGF